MTIAFGLFLLLISSELHAAVQLIYPAEKSRVYRSDYLILKTNDNSISGIRLTINGVDSDILQIGSPDYHKMFQDILIVKPVWDTGKNTLLIEAFNGGAKVQSITADLFFNPSGDRSLVPKEYNDVPLHTPGTEKICSPCHNMESPDPQKSASQVDSPCASCHAGLIKVKYSHDPVVGYNCSFCHLKNERMRHGTGKRDAALCYECHSDIADEIKKNPFPHGPVVAGYCELCHEPHGSEFPGFMRRPINEVCLSCHEKIGKEPHVTRNSSSGGHPLSGKKDISPKRQGKELSCASCHEPHGGAVRYFLVSRKEERMALCQFCHAK